MIVDITNLLRKTCNVFSLDICANFSTEKSRLTAMDICSMASAYVRHLAVSIKNITEAETVLHRLEHLLSVNFFFDHGPYWDPFIAWLKIHKKGSIYHRIAFFICICFKQNNVQYKELEVANKRMKLTDDHYSV